MGKRPGPWLMLLLYLTLGVGTAMAVVLDERPQLDLATDLEWFRDRGGTLEPDAVARDAAFAPVSPRDLTPGFSRDVFWLRFTLRNPAGEPATRWLTVGHPRLRSVSLFWLGPAGWMHLAAGTAVPVSAKPLDFPEPVLPVVLAANVVQVYLIRVSSETAIDLHASLWQPAAYLAAERWTLFKVTLSMGGSLAAGLMGLGAFALLRQRIYLHFGLTLVFAAAIEAAREGLLQAWFWPAGLPFYPPVIPWLGGLVSLCFIRFQQDFLTLGSRLPGWNRFFKLLSAIIVAAMIGSAFRYWLWVRVLSAAALVMLVGSLAVNGVAWRRGFRPARLLALTFGSFCTVESLRQLANLGMLEFPEAMQFSMPAALLAATPLILIALTERGRELASLLVQVKAESEARIDFLARMSHELRSPLSSILGYAGLLSRPASQISLAEGVTAIDRSGRHLLGMIDEILDYARGEAGRLPVTRSAVNWQDFRDDLERNARLLASGANNGFRLTEHGTFPASLKLDARRLRQVLDNLLINANRYARNGQVGLHCVLEPANPGGMSGNGTSFLLNFEVVDDGPGIPPEEQASVFLPFVRGSAAGLHERGAGMGLPIARQLVSLMGGELSLESRAGKGCRFRFAIPVESEEPAPVTEAHRSRGWIASGGTRRLLVVDDDATVRRLLRTLLVEHGFEVMEADGAKSARHWLRKNPDLILTDQFMAQGDGWSLLRESRKRCPQRPVVLLSAAPPNPSPRHPRGVEFSAVFLKPWDEHALLECISHFLSVEWKSRTAGPTPPKTGTPLRSAGNVMKSGHADAAGSGSAPGSDSPAASSECPASPLSAMELARLQAMVRNGQITDILNWAAVLGHDPVKAACAAEIRHAARAIDLARLEALCYLGKGESCLDKPDQDDSCND